MVVFDGLKFDFRLASMKMSQILMMSLSGRSYMMRNLAESWLQCPATVMRRIPERLQRKTRKRAAERKHKHITAVLVYVDMGT